MLVVGEIPINGLVCKLHHDRPACPSEYGCNRFLQSGCPFCCTTKSQMMVVVNYAIKTTTTTTTTTTTLWSIKKRDTFIFSITLANFDGFS